VRQAALDQWGTNVFDSTLLADLRMPDAFEAAAQHTDADDLEGQIVMSADLGEHTDRLQEFAALGFDEIYLHNVHRDQETFIRDFGEKVLPALES
jgi:coenzyme F420-dependent glucose-6-phosphate dehydrogenase